MKTTLYVATLVILLPFVAGGFLFCAVAIGFHIGVNLFLDYTKWL